MARADLVRSRENNAAEQKKELSNRHKNTRLAQWSMALEEPATSNTAAEQSTLQIPTNVTTSIAGPTEEGLTAYPTFSKKEPALFARWIQRVAHPHALP